MVYLTANPRKILNSLVCVVCVLVISCLPAKAQFNQCVYEDFEDGDSDETSSPNPGIEWDVINVGNSWVLHVDPTIVPQNYSSNFYLYDMQTFDMQFSFDFNPQTLNTSHDLICSVVRWDHDSKADSYGSIELKQLHGEWYIRYAYVSNGNFGYNAGNPLRARLLVNNWYRLITKVSGQIITGYVYDYETNTLLGGVSSVATGITEIGGTVAISTLKNELWIDNVDLLCDGSPVPVSTGTIVPTPTSTPTNTQTSTPISSFTPFSTPTPVPANLNFCVYEDFEDGDSDETSTVTLENNWTIEDVNSNNVLHVIPGNDHSTFIVYEPYTMDLQFSFDFFPLTVNTHHDLIASCFRWNVVDGGHSYGTVEVKQNSHGWYIRYACLDRGSFRYYPGNYLSEPIQNGAWYRLVTKANGSLVEGYVYNIANNSLIGYMGHSADCVVSDYGRVSLTTIGNELYFDNLSLFCDGPSIPVETALPSAIRMAGYWNTNLEQTGGDVYFYVLVEDNAANELATLELLPMGLPTGIQLVPHPQHHGIFYYHSYISFTGIDPTKTVFKLKENYLSGESQVCWPYLTVYP